MALPSGMGACAMCVEMMAGTATSWTDVSDWMSVVDPPTQTRPTGSATVFGEDTAVIAVGHREPVEVSIQGVFANGTTSAFYTAYAQFTSSCGGKVAVRWSPGGCATTEDAFYTSSTLSELSSLTFPGGDSNSADIIMWSATVYSPDITRATWA